jgi:hypothetical protein
MADILLTSYKNMTSIKVAHNLKIYGSKSTSKINFDMKRFNLKKLHEVKGKKQYQVKISKQVWSYRKLR